MTANLTWAQTCSVICFLLAEKQIAQELDLEHSDVQQMPTLLREGVIKKPAMMLDGQVEVDEVYVVSGHKGEQCSVSVSG